MNFYGANNNFGSFDDEENHDEDDIASGSQSQLTLLMVKEDCEPAKTVQEQTSQVHNQASKVHEQKTSKVQEAVWDITQAQDLTIHFELDLNRDLEPELEVFNRYNRLGQFRAAKEYFSTNLEAHMSNHYVAVQYAAMLLRMGDYRSIEALKLPETGLVTQKVNAQAIQLCSKIHTASVSTHQVKEIVRLSVNNMQHSTKQPESQGSMEYLMASLTFYLARCYRLKDIMQDHELLNWESIYHTLLREGRIWDLVDLLVSAISYYGTDSLQTSIWGNDSSKILPEVLTSEWLMQGSDEATELGLLDIVLSLMLYEMETSEGHFHPMDQRHRYTDKADELVAYVVEHRPGNLETRQYIRWALLKLALKAKAPSNAPRLLSALPGLLLRGHSPLQLPIYVPRKREIPKLPQFSLPASDLTTLRMLIKVARRLGDYRTEAYCLTLYISAVQPQDRLEALQELIELQDTRQNDRQGLLASCLSKYTICRDLTSRSALRKEILSFSDFISFTPELTWARHMILKSLAPNDSEEASSLDAALKVQDVPDFIMDFIGYDREEVDRSNGMENVNLHGTSSVTSSSGKDIDYRADQSIDIESTTRTPSDGKIEKGATLQSSIDEETWE